MCWRALSAEKGGDGEDLTLLPSSCPRLFVFLYGSWVPLPWVPQIWLSPVDGGQGHIRKGWPRVGRVALNARKGKRMSQNHGTKAVFLAFFNCVIAWVPFQALALWCEGSSLGLCPPRHPCSPGCWEWTQTTEVMPAAAPFLKKVIRLLETRSWPDGRHVDLKLWIKLWEILHLL